MLNAQRVHFLVMSAVFFLDKKGKPLLSRNYRGDVPMSAVETFPVLLMEAEDETSVVPPCFTKDGINYIYLSHNDLYILALSRNNTNVMETLLFLHRLVEVLTGYLKELAEESIRDNFVVVYELLDEVMDYGFPQTTETRILKEYITQKNRIFQLISATGIKPPGIGASPKPPVAVTNAVSWRSEGIKYSKNEAFLDVIESVNMLCSPSGQVLKSEILGRVAMKSYLSGMPELRLGLNDRVIFDHVSNTGAASPAPLGNKKPIEMEDVKFHQCVRLSRFESDRTISFIPPDGEFELMSYRLNTNVKPLIWVDCKINKHENSRIEIVARLRAQFKPRSTANDVQIIIPVPEDADSPKIKLAGAVFSKAKWKPELSAIVWKMKHLGGGKELVLQAELGLPAVSGDENQAKRPIQVKFSIPYFTTSGIQVRYLKIVESKLLYQSWPWVRYITQSGDYAIRVNT
ncbi:Apm1 protein [Starmerella bacillaris]|uniref:Apm1 protein n=1 Tax=Starmerella bacillaris TaxID=1247836 RepID=A0AAV5RPD4_STABA|nr:Apm1 protein [Starmerella bacillaris]